MINHKKYYSGNMLKKKKREVENNMKQLNFDDDRSIIINDLKKYSIQL